MIKDFLKSSAIYGISGFFSKAVGFLLIPFYTRVLTPADYGLMDYLLIITFFVGVFLSLEIYQAIARFFADLKTKEEQIKYVSSGFIFYVISFGAFAILAVLFSKPLSLILLEQAEHYLIIAVAAVYIFFNATFAYLTNILRYRILPRKFLVSSLLNTAVTVIFTVLFILVFRFGIIGVFLGLMLGAFGGSFIAFIFTADFLKPKVDKVALSKMIGFSLPLIPLSIGTYILLFIDRILIKDLLNLAQLGIYGIAYRIASVSGIIMTALNTASTPLIFANYKKADTPKQLADIFKLVFFGALSITIVLSVFSSEIVWIIATPDYYPAAFLVPFLVAAGFISKFYDYAPGLYIAKKTKLISIIYLSGAALNTLLSYLLIINFQLLGAAIAAVASASVIFLVMLFFSQKHYFIPYQYSAIVQSIMLTVLFIVLSYILETKHIFYNLSIKIVLISLYFIILLFFIKIIDVHYYFSAIKQRILRYRSTT